MDNAKTSFRVMRSPARLLAAGLLALVTATQAWAGLTDLATAPLATSSGTTVRPNILFTLDNSGSMAWDFLPDYSGGGMGSSYPHCKSSTQCTNGLPPFQANAYNGLAYNPATSYLPPVNYDGTVKPSQTAANTTSWTAVKVDGYGVQSTGTINMTTGYGETIYCDAAGSGICKRNGIDNNNPFFLDATGTGNPNAYAYPGTDLSITAPSNVYALGCPWCSLAGNGYPPTPAYVSTVTTAPWLTAPNWQYGMAMNGVQTSAVQLFTGSLANGSPATTIINLNSPTVSLSGSTVTLTYVTQTPAAPVVASGDTITVNGSNCGAAYVVNSKPLTVVSGTQVKYTSPSGSGTTKKTCGTVTVAHTTIPVVTAPSIASNNITVTVALNSLVDAGGHTLAIGDSIQVSGAGCDAGYQVANALVTGVNTATNTFTYTAQAVLGVANNTACTISRLVMAMPPSPGISINGNIVTVKLNGCCATGAPNGADYILRSSSPTTSGDYVFAWCNGSAFWSFAGIVPVQVIDANTFTYHGTANGTTGTASCGFLKYTFPTVPAVLNFTSPATQNGAPYEYVIIPVEFCDSPYLTNCVASSVPTGTFTYPAPVRFCSSSAAAALPPGAPGAQVAAGTINCQGLFSTGGTTNYTSVRYGLFYRIDVVNTNPTYGDVVLNGTFDANGVPITFAGVKVLSRASRTDCLAAPNCTYTEEMTNFANWYAYYHTRIQMMKTSAGKAFLPMDARYRVGFATINESWVVPTATTGGQWLPVAMFDTAPGGQKQKWYNAMYSINPGNSTPLREAVARAGRYFAGQKGLPGDPITDDPMEYSCQQNFLLITTDGYWNGTTSNVKDLAGAQIGNVDNNSSNPATTRGEGVYDGGVAGASTTLADTAAYYYLNDLRTAALGNCLSGSTTAPGSPLCTSPAVSPDPLDNVPAGPKDPVAGGLMWQHMVTFSLGLANGLMLYQPDYETATTGDVASIKTGAMNCPFSGAGICNWPLPASDSPTALDDLWHAAVNGRGVFYNARDPVSLSKGLSGALSGIQVQTGSAAASATSSPNITQTDRSIFSSTYRTVKWDGEVVAQLLDPVTGNVPPATLTALVPPVTSIMLSGNTVVVNMVNHGLTTGDMIQVANLATGVCDPAFNTGGQSFPVTVIDANNFSYTSPNSAGATLNTACQVFKAGISWSAQTQLDLKVKAAVAMGDPYINTRFIWTDDTTQAFPLNIAGGANGLKAFQYANMSAADQAYFDNHCTSTTGAILMSQCTAINLTTAQITSANVGDNLIKYLRGDQTLEQTLPNPSYRPRDHFLGDTVNARPAYVRAPTFGYTDAVTPTYATFQTNNQTRLATIYVAANDGMLHAFGAGQCTSTTSCTVGTGNERWAYVPHETLSNLYKLADVNYAHQYYVDGSPEVMDIFVNSAYSTASGLPVGWHTILVGGLNGGGRGYYVLDITDPSNPIGLWDICATGVVGQCSVQDADLGYTYGNPVITKRSSDGNWVVLFTSGYNNVTPGSGQGFLYVMDAIMGNILQKIPTGSGSTTTPSGLSRIAAWADNSQQNNTARFIYGGDLNGDVWRFDLGPVVSTYSMTGAVAAATFPTVSPPAARFTTLYSDTSATTPFGLTPQPITTRPELGDPWTTPGSINSLSATGQPAVFIGTGRYLGASDLPLPSPPAPAPQVQTIYALKDDFSRAGNLFPAVPTVPNPRALPAGGFLQPMVVQTINPATGSSSNNAVDWATKEGWYADFPGSGERNNLDPQLVLGTLIVVTNVPTSSGACVTGGTSFMYQFNFRNGNNLPGAVARTALGNAISVGFVAVRLPSGQLKVIVTNATGSKSTQTVNVSGSATTRNVSWRELLQ